MSFTIRRLPTVTDELPRVLPSIREMTPWPAPACKADVMTENPNPREEELRQTQPDTTENKTAPNEQDDEKLLGDEEELPLMPDEG